MSTIREHCLAVASRGYIGDLRADVEIRKLCEGLAQSFQGAVDLGAIAESDVLEMETWPELLGFLKFATDAVREVVPDEWKFLVPVCPTIREMFGELLESRE